MAVASGSLLPHGLPITMLLETLLALISQASWAVADESLQALGMVLAEHHDLSNFHNLIKASVKNPVPHGWRGVEMAKLTAA